jgi:energy-converting hydrogenase Eha subunit H
MLPFGAAMGIMTTFIIIITVTFVVITIILVRSRKRLRVDLERLKAKTIEQPAIYEELEYVHMAMAPPKPASSPTIDTGQNTAYASFSGFFNK